MSTYEPDPFPAGDDVVSLANWLWREFNKLAAAFLGIENILLEEKNVEPEKPRSGLIVLADGTNWNPGDGQGFYGYYAGSWHKLG